LEELSKKQHALIERMDPIIQKQSKVISEQARAEKYRKIEVLDGIQSNLTLSKGSLDYISQMQKNDFESASSVKDEYERMIRFSKSLDESLASNYYWLGVLTVEISNVARIVNNYAQSQIFYEIKLNTIEKLRDEIEKIIPKVISLKEDIRK